ncbi:hypothetical protein K443DRAFT_686641, partial [Laccaria amethystina LaAM-08-1]
MHPTIYHHPITGLRLPLSKLALCSSQLWLVCHSIVQERAGRRPLSEQRRTTSRS